jgi:hypothetical protein
MTMAVVTMTFQVARIRRLATTIQARRRTTVLASKMTSVVFAAVMASLKAHAIATETYWTSAEFAAAMALRTAPVIATETYWMPWVNAEVRARQMRIRMAFVTIKNRLVARMRRLATTIQAPRRTTVLALKMTSVVFAAVTALLTAHAIVMET